jgi:allantoinase
MGSSETWFVGRRVFRGGQWGPAAIGVRQGTIACIETPEAVPAGAPVVDVGDACLLPGIVDTHVHINEPGRTEWEGFVSATRAAAAGGVTTLVDMPLNSIPPTTTVPHLLKKAEAMEGKCAVDVGLWGGVIPGNVAELRAMVAAGALGFKCFMVDSGVDEFPPVDADGIRDALLALREDGVTLLAHAELEGPLRDAMRGPLPTDPSSYLRYLRSRPSQAEDEAIALLASLAKETRASMHVVHLSSANALPILRRAQDEGLALSAETAPHYLYFQSETIPEGATPYKCAPPIRESANRQRLWEGLRDGTVSMVVTDHSPCTPELKRLASGSFDDAWGGIASLQLGLSATWTEASARGIALETMLPWLTEAPARLAGLSGRKGKIAVGFDADFVVFQPDEFFQVEADRLYHRHPLTPYQGARLRGVVRATYLRGQKVFDQTQGPKGRSGQWTKRA